MGKRRKEELQEFKQWLIEEQGLSTRTAGTYMRCVQSSLKRRSIFAVIRDLDASKSARVLYRSALIQWADYKGDDDLMKTLKDKKLSQSIKREGHHLPKKVHPIPDEQMRKFISALSAMKGAPGVEPWVWPALSIFRKLALRARVDLCQIQREAAIEALETGALQIYTKGGRVREVPAQQVRQELEALIDLGKWVMLADIISPRAHPPSRQEAAYKKIVYYLKAIAEAAGIDPKVVHAHRFRHTRAVEVYRKTKDIRVVQKLLGHDSIKTTQDYLQIDLNEVSEGMEGLD